MHKSKQMVESYVFFREEQRKAEIEKKTQPKKNTQMTQLLCVLNVLIVFQYSYNATQ